MKAVHALDLLVLVGAHAGEPVAHRDPLDHEDSVALEDLALRLGVERVTFDLNPARLQRAREGARQSASRGGDHVVEARGLRCEVLGRDAVVLGDLGVNAELDRLAARR